MYDFYMISKSCSGEYEQEVVSSSIKDFLFTEFPIRSLFSLYKSKDRLRRHSCGLPINDIDYKNNYVNVIITELDSYKHIYNQKDYCKKSFNLSEHTAEVFNKLKKDKNILASYISGSGDGLRIIFKVDSSISNDLEYISNMYFYTKYFKDKYDKNDCLCLDNTCNEEGNFFINHSVIYWFTPTQLQYVYVNENAEPLPKI